MPWSTREIAGLAGVTVRAVRHYHAIGLLPEPDRRLNGYKQYGVEHLHHILRIKRLTDLGLSLTHIAAMGDQEKQPRETLMMLEAELAHTIQRLEHSRAEIRAALEQPVPAGEPVDLRPAFTALDAVTDKDRQFIAILNHLFTPEQQNVYAARIRIMSGDPAFKDFDLLPEDAGEATRQELAARLVRLHDETRRLHPHLGDDPVPVTGAGAEVFEECLHIFCNEAQRDVARRLWRLRQH
jgi:DNA-binding transcriptional MerR regulator